MVRNTEERKGRGEKEDGTWTFGAKLKAGALGSIYFPPSSSSYEEHGLQDGVLRSKSSVLKETVVLYSKYAVNADPQVYTNLTP